MKNKILLKTFLLLLINFKIFAQQIPAGGKIFFSNDDKTLKKVMDETNCQASKIPYEALQYLVEDGKTILQIGNKKIETEIFGRHNMLNLSVAKMVVNELGVSDEIFFDSIKNFRGAAKRLELVAKNNSSVK